MHYGSLQTPPRTVFKARKLRRICTRAEAMLWQKLRAHRFHGFKFRRQSPVGPYIVDFLCSKAHLIVEVDGDTHWEEHQKRHDERRTIFLQERGYRVRRFCNHDVFENLYGVLEAIGRELGVEYEQCPQRGPSP